MAVRQCWCGDEVVSDLWFWISGCRCGWVWLDLCFGTVVANWSLSLSLAMQCDVVDGCGASWLVGDCGCGSVAVVVLVMLCGAV
ncbi:Hypothetical predicted protein [Olea europaea subsp. europaea]|uniref:Uncharacterized protein n=1 Tax=Olea europaea subsp. europaea TaxID=158383 RepID=A0A8S0VAN8_OLEEU|nr:Hypothetical predicted protein [Olea europaea subsp. europaea]